MSPRRLRRSVFAALAIALLAVVSACGGGSAGSPAEVADVADSTTMPARGPTVVVKSSTFEPSRIRITAGESVTWKFNDRALAHNVVAKDGEFSSPLKRGGAFSHQFAEPGTYSYRCTLHPQMKGTVEVS